MPRTEICNCWTHCNGGKRVSQTTFNNHAQYRTPEALAAALAPLVNPPSAESEDDDDYSSTDSSAPSSSPVRAMSTPHKSHRRPMGEPSPPKKRLRVESEAPRGDEDEGMDFFVAPSGPFDDDDGSFPMEVEPAAYDEPEDGDKPDPGSLAYQLDSDSDSESELEVVDVEDDNAMEVILDQEEPVPVPAGSNRPRAHRDDLRIIQDFQDEIRAATFENSRISKECLHRLRNPPTTPLDLSDDTICFSIQLFVALLNSSEATFKDVCDVIALNKGTQLLSLDKVKETVAEMTGVYALQGEMCRNSCLAFAGPFAALDTCPDCGSPRRDENGATTKFYTMPLGPQIQALFRNPETARLMQYRLEETKHVFAELEENEGVIKVRICAEPSAFSSPAFEDYVDLFCGDEYLSAVEDGRITDDDVVILGSLDGAQLFRNKKTDC
uniref:Uncharacterized protein n=1 Tax=Mycena chlorophos TaxID=658473 RepID=A0ABQ0MCQ3_MYCCL|nr:predicted protein [Mycena chlorophos]